MVILEEKREERTGKSEERERRRGEGEEEWRVGRGGVRRGEE